MVFLAHHELGHAPYHIASEVAAGGTSSVVIGLQMFAIFLGGIAGGFIGMLAAVGHAISRRK